MEGGTGCSEFCAILVAGTRRFGHSDRYRNGIDNYDLKCLLDHHFHVSLSSTTLGLPIKGGKPLHVGRSDLSLKNNS